MVEDHAVFRKFLYSWLTRFYRVQAVRDGFEALKWLQAGNVPDAVLLDMEMPRLDGYQFLRNIRYSGIFSEVPVIALTGDRHEVVAQRCAGFRLANIFAKPYKPSLLLDAIKAVLHKQPARLAA